MFGGLHSDRRELDLSCFGWKFVMPTVSQSLSNITILDLSGNKLQNCNFMKFLPSLHECDVSFNRITELMSNVACGTEKTLKVKRLNLSFNKLTHVKSLCDIKKLAFLVELDLTANPLHTTSLDYLCKLTAATIKFDVNTILTGRNDLPKPQIQQFVRNSSDCILPLDFLSCFRTPVDTSSITWLNLNDSGLHDLPKELKEYVFFDCSYSMR